MAVPYSLNTLIAALLVVANAHRFHPVVPALHDRFDEARREQRKRRRAAPGISRKTLYTYISKIGDFLLRERAARADEPDFFKLAGAFIAAEPRCAHRYYSSIPAYQFHVLIQFIAERNLWDVRALAGSRNVSGSDELYYQLYDFIGAAPPEGMGDIHGHYYAYRPSLSAPPKILKSLVQIERKPSGAFGYLERMEYNTKEDGSRWQVLEGFVLNTGQDVFVLTRDTNTNFIQTTYLDFDFRHAQAGNKHRIVRMKGRYNGITFNAAHARIFSTSIVLEAASDPAARAKNLWDDSILDLSGIGLHHPDDLPDAIVSRLERYGYQRPRKKAPRQRLAQK